jgi:vacuolar-type H+-ATPase subunit H
LGEGKNIMWDVIQKVIATEAEAKRMVQVAKAEAEQVLSGARKRAQKLTTDARNEAQLEAQKILATVLADAEDNKQIRLASFAAEIEKKIGLDAVSHEQAVKAVVRCVCG